MASASAAAIKTEKRKEKEEEKEKEKKKKQQPVNEIEEIFRKAKRNRKDSDIDDKVKNGTTIREERVEKEKKKKIENVEDEGSLKKKNRRKTADGLTIYSAKELGIGNPDAGDTPLCPFDCSCCF